MNKTTAIVFFGIILVGLGISLVTLNKCGKPTELPESDQPVSENSETKTGSKSSDPEEMSEKSGGKDTKVAGSEKAKQKGDTQDGPGKSTAEFSTPEAAMKALSQAAAQKDFDAFLEFVGEKAVPKGIQKQIKSLLEDPKVTLSEEKPFTEISKSAKSVRWALNFESEDQEVSSELYADIADAGAKSFQVSKLALPLDPESMSSSKKGSGTATSGPAGKTGSGDDPKAMPDEEKPDALVVAHAFTRAIIQRDFKLARALSDPEAVTDERVAALMIAVEEGNFTLKEDRPLVVTLSREDITWVLSRIQSPDASSEFAVELGQTGGDWRVNGLTFSKVLSALAQAAGGGNVAYSPIVEDPEGGDSLVLYFEFDQAGVTSRGNRQLAIVADILSQSSDRVIRINGHADSMGSDQYNSTLSNNRADSIRAALISMGVAPNQVVTEAFGETKPRRPNFNPDGSDNPTGRSENRRAEVYLDF